MDVIPGEEPSCGPNYYNFDPSVAYTFHVDNDRDGTGRRRRLRAPVPNEIRGAATALGLPLAYLGGRRAGHAIRRSRARLGGPRPAAALHDHDDQGRTARGLSPALDLIAVPSNVGPRTMPNYDALAAQGMYDLGAASGSSPDSATTRSTSTSGARLRHAEPALAGDGHAVRLQRPHDRARGAGEHAHTRPERSGHDRTAVVGAYASTSRPKVTVNGTGRGARMVQVQRLANPLVNELIIGTKDKDRWNTLDPSRSRGSSTTTRTRGSRSRCRSSSALPSRRRPGTISRGRCSSTARPTAATRSCSGST